MWIPLARLLLNERYHMNITILIFYLKKVMLLKASSSGDREQCDPIGRILSSVRA